MAENHGFGTASWVIRNKLTKESVLETFSPDTVSRINTDKYEAVPILQHLQEFNRAAKTQG